MNKGLKNYTKQLQFETGLVKTYINLNKNDSNTHVEVPLIDVDSPTPINLSLIYDNLNKNSETLFGKGFKLNFFASINHSNKITVTNADGSTDEFIYDIATKKYINKPSGLSVTVDSVSDDYSTLIKGYNFEDLQGNITKYSVSSNYPSTVTMKSGACYDFDFISSPITITNNSGDAISLCKTGDLVSEVKYKDTSVILTYDENSRLNGMRYKRGEREVGNITFYMFDCSIEIYDKYNMKSLSIAFDSNGRPSEVNEGIIDADIERTTAITYNDKETIVQNYLGNLVRVVFDEEDYPSYVVNEDGVVNATEYDHSIRKVVYQSTDIDCIHKLPNLLDTDNIDFINLLNGATVTPTTLSQDNFYSKIMGNSLRRVTTTTNNTLGIETLPIKGLAGESFTIALWGRCVQEGSTPCELRVGIGSADKCIKLRKDGLFDFISTGFTTDETFNEISISLIISEGCVVEIGGLQLIRKQFGIEYKYDDKGNLIAATQNGNTNTIAYDSNSNLPTESVDSNKMVYSYEYDDKGNLVKTYGAYCVNTENTYTDSTIKRLLSSKISNKDGSKILSKSNTYDTNNRYVTSETDELGNVTRYENIDRYGTIGKIVYANNSILESNYDNGLLKTLKLLSDSNELMSCSYTYDTNNRLTTVMVKNGSVYSFSYDAANNITQIQLNGRTIFAFEYDLLKNNLVKQTYGDDTAYRFSYNEDNMLTDVYFERENSSQLKYHYIYDEKKRLSTVEDSQGTVLKSYVYDNENQVIEEKAADYSIKCSLSAGGEVLATSSTVNGETISQSYSSLAQSKSFNPDSFSRTFSKDYFGAFTKNTLLRGFDGSVVNIYEKTLNPDSFANNGSPYVSIDSKHLLGYVFDPELSSDCFCCTVMMWIKPKNLSNNKVVFMVQNTDGIDSLIGKLNNNKLEIIIKDRNGSQKTLATTTSTLNLNKWNFVAIHFRRRYDGEGYDDEKRAYIMLNQEIINVEASKLECFTHCDFNIPLYTISHGTKIQSDTENNPVFESFDVLNSDVSCLLITNRYGVSIKEIQKFYNETKLYVMDTTLKEADLASVDFSLTSLHSNDDTFTKNFTLYPLQNEFKSTKGDEPISWSYRESYGDQTGKSFAFDRVTKGYAYVADGAELVLKSESNTTKTILMKVFIEPGINSYYTTAYPNDTSKIKRYIFDFADDQNKNIALGLDKDNKLVLNRFGSENSFDYTFNTNQWYTIAFSYGMVNGKWLWTIIIDYSVIFNGEGAYGSYSGTTKLSIGRKYIPYDSDQYSRFNELEYYPLYGQIKQVAISDKYFNTNELRSLLANLSEINKVTMFDEMGMLNKTVLRNNTQAILSNCYTYKTQADTPLADVAGADEQELAKHISPIVKAEEIKCGSTTTTRAYTTDTMGNVTAITDNVFGNHLYTYDNRQFLVKADDETYEYDSNGNITKIGNRTLRYNSIMKDKLISVDNNVVNYASEESLNPSSYNGNRYLYEGRRLTKYIPLTSAISTITYDYIYNDKGLRTKKIKKSTRAGRTTTTTTNFFYDNNKLICQIGNNKRMDFLYDENGQLYGLFYNGTKYFYVRDVLQNILGIVDSSGSIVVKYNYTGYGATTVSGSLATTLGKDNPFRFKGYYFDEESSMYYCQSRYYVPEWGRWLNADSAASLDEFSLMDLNLFAYCGNDPVNLYDPSGHAPEWLQGLAIGLAIVGAVLVIGAVTVLTCGVGTLAGTMAGAVIYGAAQGIAIGAAVGVVGGGIVGGIASDWSAEGILIGMGIGLGAGAIVGGVIGGFAGASGFTANSAYISQYGGNVKEVLSAYKGNPRLKVLNSNTTAYRTWGGTSGKFGHWISPKNYGSAARSMLSLPPGNTAANTSQFLISKGSTILSGKAAALFGQTGGGIQWWIGLL